MDTDKTKKLWEIYKEAPAHSVNPVKLIQLMSAEAVSALCRREVPRFSLKKLIGKAPFGDYFYLWEHIFSMKDDLPEKYIFDIFWTVFNDRGNICNQQLTTPEGRVSFDFSARDRELLAKLPLTSELLIDNPTVIYRYCQVKKPGWEHLRYIQGRRVTTLKLPEKMRDAIAQDRVEVFMIYKEMAARKFSFSLIYEIMDCGAVNIFRYLLKNEETFNAVPLEELCFCCAAGFSDEKGVKLLQVIDEVFPGKIAGVRDHWGRNLLWYVMHNTRTVFLHPFCKLAEFLIEKGCDPDNRNHLGIPWRKSAVTLGMEEKRKFLQRRSQANIFWSLTNKMPMYALADKSYYPAWMLEGELALPLREKSC